RCAVSQGIRYEQEPTRHYADEAEPRFTVFIALKRTHGKRIVENLPRNLEAHSVLGEISRCLLGVPFELFGHTTRYPYMSNPLRATATNECATMPSTQGFGQQGAACRA